MITSYSNKIEELGQHEQVLEKEIILWVIIVLYYKMKQLEVNQQSYRTKLYLFNYGNNKN